MTPVAESTPDLAELLAEVRRIEVASKRIVTSVMAGGYVSAFRGAGLEVDAVREYAEGDDPRTVDWNVTARMGRPFVKTYVEERERTVLFLLDLSASMGGGFGVWSSRQTAARVCAVLALSAMRSGDKVGLLAFSDVVELYVPAKRGPGHALRIVRDCLALPTRDARTDAVPALSFVARAVRRHAIVFVVSDFLVSPPDWDGWRRALARCARRHDVVAVRLVAPELAIEAAGVLAVRDPESRAAFLLDTNSARVRAAYARRVADWTSRTERDLLRMRVDQMLVPVPRSPGKNLVAGPILAFFRMRETRARNR